MDLCHSRRECAPGMGRSPPLDQCRLPSPVHLPGFPWEASETMTYPAVHLPQHRGRLAEATVALPSLQILMQRRDDGLQATPLVPVQSALTRALNRSRAFGATFRRPGDFPPVKLHPRKLRCWGQATALFCAFTLSFRRWVMNRLILAMPVPRLADSARRDCYQRHSGSIGALGAPTP